MGYHCDSVSYNLFIYYIFHITNAHEAKLVLVLALSRVDNVGDFWAQFGAFETIVRTKRCYPQITYTLFKKRESWQYQNGRIHLVSLELAS